MEKYSRKVICYVLFLINLDILNLNSNNSKRQLNVYNLR